MKTNLITKDGFVGFLEGFNLEFYQIVNGHKQLFGNSIDLNHDNFWDEGEEKEALDSYCDNVLDVDISLLEYGEIDTKFDYWIQI